MKLSHRLSKTALSCLLACSCTGFALAGCNSAQTSSASSQQAQTESTASSGSAQQQETQTVQGDTAQNTQTASVTLGNQTGFDFVKVQIKPSSTALFGNEPTYEFTLANGGTETLTFAADTSTNSVYDFLFFTANDETHIAVNEIDVLNMKDIVLQFEDGYGFVTFVDANGETGSNKEANIQRVADQDGDIVTHDQQTQLG